jgi:hypothetical protein
MINRPGGLFGFAMVAFLAQVASAQVVPVSEFNTQKDFFTLSDTKRTGDDSLVFTVVGNSKLVVTDLVATHNVIDTNSTFRLNFSRSSNNCESVTQLLTPYVNPLETLSINLSTGLEFLPGESICAGVGGAGAGEGITFNLSGWTGPVVNGP